MTIAGYSETSVPSVKLHGITWQTIIYMHILGPFANLRKATVSSCLSVSLVARPSACLSAWNSSAPTGRIFLSFHFYVFFEYLPRKFKFHYSMTWTKGSLHEGLNARTFMTIHRWILFRMRKVSDESCTENQNILCSTTFSENSPFYEIMWKNTIVPERPQMTI